MSFSPSKIPVLVTEMFNFLTHQENKNKKKNHTKKCRVKQKLPILKQGVWLTEASQKGLVKKCIWLILGTALR